MDTHQRSDLPLLDELQVLRARIAKLEQSESHQDDLRLLEAIEHIGKAVRVHLDLDTLLDTLVREIIEAGVFRSLSVALVNHEVHQVCVIRRMNRFKGQKLIPIEQCYMNKTPLMISLNSGNITALVARTGQMEVIDGWDDRFAIDIKPEDVGLKSFEPHSLGSFLGSSFYFFPIFHDGLIVAVLATASKTAEKEDILVRIQKLSALFDQVALALQNAQLHQQVQSHAARLAEEVARQTETLRQQTQELEEKNRLLNASFQELESIYLYSPIGLFILDRDLRLLRFNRRLAEINGLTDADLGRSLYDIIPDQIGQRKAHFLQVFETGIPLLDVEVHGYIPRKSDEAKVWLANYFPIQSESGFVEKILGAVVDITALKNAEQALRNNDARLQQAMHVGRIGIWDWEIATDRTVWTGDMFRVYGITPETFTGKGADYLAFTHIEDRDGQMANIQKALHLATEKAQGITNDLAEPFFSPRVCTIIV